MVVVFSAGEDYFDISAHPFDQMVDFFSFSFERAKYFHEDYLNEKCTLAPLLDKRSSLALNCR